MPTFPYCHFFSCRFPFLCTILVIRPLESPGELLALVGGLPALQSSWRGQCRWWRLHVLRQVVEKRSWKTKNPKSPKAEKRIDKTNKKRKANKMPMWLAQGPSSSWGSTAVSVPAAKSKLPHVAIHGAFLGVREARISGTRRHRCLREPRGHRHLIEDCSRGKGPSADLRICVSFARWSCHVRPSSSEGNLGSCRC
jgi:hypothetical protein